VVNTTSEHFPHSVRIVKSADYRTIYREGRKIQSEKFVLFALKNKVGHHRIGITVSKKIGGAVIRNRVKRLFREIFRKSSSDLPNQYDIVVNAKSGCVGASYIELREEFLASVRRFCR
jgi:ribonuclease P protein component